MDPQSGRILLDGTPLNQWTLSPLREVFGYVPQDVFLFSDTIGNNIAFGNHTARSKDESVRQAARDACVHEDISEFEHGYDTMLGERGVNLSGGQKQRISIARALIKQPSVLLLDDCLSAVDTETEDHILDAVRRQQTVCTIVVSHRLASLRGADRILVLDEGRLVEEGTQEELLKANGLFALMHEQQQGSAHLAEIQNLRFQGSQGTE